MKKNLKIYFSVIMALFLSVCFFGNASAAATTTGSFDVNLDVKCDETDIINFQINELRFNGAKINWQTTDRALCAIYYGTTTSYANSRTESEYLDFHYFNLTQLSSGTDYHFKIICQNMCGAYNQTEDAIFHTPDTPGTPIGPIVPPIIPPVPPTQEVIEEITKIAPEISTIIDKIAENPASRVLVIVATILAVAGLAISSLLPLIANLPMLSFWDGVWGNFLFFLGWTRKRRKWGIVFDSSTGEPIPFASVRIFDFKEKKLLQSQLTNKEGTYGFKIKPGEYYLEVFKKDYTYPTTKMNNAYRGALIKVKEDTVVSLDIAVDADESKLSLGLKIINQITNFINFIRVPVLVIGTVLSIIFMFWQPNNILNFLVVGLYLALWIHEWIELRKPKTIGHVMDAVSRAPVGLAIVRVFDDENKKLVGTKVSDIKGKYFYLLTPGTYDIKASKENYEPFELDKLHFSSGDFLSKDILMKKESSVASKSVENTKQDESADKPEKIKSAEKAKAS